MEHKSDNNSSLYVYDLSLKKGRSASVGGQTTITALIDKTTIPNPEKLVGYDEFSAKPGNIKVKEEYIHTVKEDYVSSEDEDSYAVKGEYVSSAEEDIYPVKEENTSSEDEDTSRKGENVSYEKEDSYPEKGENLSSQEEDIYAVKVEYVSSEEEDTSGKKENVSSEEKDTSEKGENMSSAQIEGSFRQGEETSIRAGKTGRKLSRKKAVRNTESDIVQNVTNTQHKPGQDKLKCYRSREISEDLRRQVVEAHKDGKGYKKISKELDLHLSAVRKIIYKWKKFNTVVTLPRSGRPAKISAKAHQKILKHMRENTSVTAKDLKASLALDNINVHESTIKRTLSKWCSWDFNMEEDTALQQE